MLTPGSVFHDRYRIERCLKCGGMGSVWEVTDLKTKRHRALKTMLPDSISDPDLRARFNLEATVTSQIDSEHLVEIFDADIDAPTGVPFIVMELLKGEDLGDLVQRVKRLAPPEVVTFLSQAGRTLDRAHALGIVHRDLKPENLFLTRRDDGSPRVRILDFGVAKLLTASTRWKTTGIVGTPLYMAPEQAIGDGGIGPATDIYAMGHIAFTLLVGEAFWEEASRGVSPLILLGKVAQGACESASERAAALGVTLPPGFSAWFAQSTAMSPRSRFETASEQVEALARALDVPVSGEPARDYAASGGSSHYVSSPTQPSAPITNAVLSRDPSFTPPGRSKGSIVLALLASAVVATIFVVMVLRRNTATHLSSAGTAPPMLAATKVPAATSLHPTEPPPGLTRSDPTASASSSIIEISGALGSASVAPPPLLPRRDVIASTRSRATFVQAVATTPPPILSSQPADPSDRLLQDAPIDRPRTPSLPRDPSDRY